MRDENMSYTVKSSERLRKSGSEAETKALLYLMNFRPDSDDIYYFVVDFFLDRCGEDFLAASFHDEAVSREQLFLNSWQSALYRGLEEHIDFVTQWLRL